MELSLDRPGDHLFIRSYTNGRVKVVDEEYPLPLLLTSRAIHSDWLPAGFEQLDMAVIKKLSSLKPEIALIGTGERQQFLPPRIQAAFYQRGVGVETMTNDAACRTFNILASESREVLVALLLN